MKKLFLVVLSISVFIAAFVLEGGSVVQLIVPTVFIPLVLGGLFSTLFSFSFTEIVAAFKDGFSEEVRAENVNNYHKGILIVQNLESAILFWSLTLVLLAAILILTNLANPNGLGPAFAVAFLSPTYGFGCKAALFVPMRHSLQNKILYLKQKDLTAQTLNQPTLDILPQSLQ